MNADSALGYAEDVRIVCRLEPGHEHERTGAGLERLAGPMREAGLPLTDGRSPYECGLDVEQPELRALTLAESAFGLDLPQALEDHADPPAGGIGYTCPMGIWKDEFIAPAQPVLVAAEAFAALAADLVRERVVRTPWLLAAGDLCANAELPYIGVLGRARWDDPPVGTRLKSDLPPWADEDDEPPPWGWARESATLLAKGDDVDTLPEALASAPYGAEDIGLAFHSLDFTNRDIDDHYFGDDNRILLACFALAHPQKRPMDTNSCHNPSGPFHPVRTFVSTGFKLGREGPCPPLAAVLRRHLGPDLVCGRTRG
ncbi:hypothetical protein [Streptomyces sp. NPDC021212]|uniref:hypothetical protein n=1 Tax=Streptomyces sp. NPDC021212 TaxID=3365118 RepID=UPI00378B6D69